MNCKKDFHLAGKLSVDEENREILLTLHTKVYLDKDEDLSSKVVLTSSPKYPMQLQNLRAKEWVVETPSRKLNRVIPQETMPIKSGLKVTGNKK